MIKKRVLIIGTGSYIGNSFYDSYKELFDIAIVDSTKPLTIDMYKGFDVVFHVAAIVHKKEKKKNASLYYSINCDLAVRSASLAKESGVSQFIFMSSESIYGKDLPIWNKVIIDNSTKPNPKSLYAKSKFLAEQKIGKLQDSSFNVLIIRAPMIYGQGCKGNYPRLIWLANHLSVIPNIENKRSMLSIGGLLLFLKSYILTCKFGVVYPRDDCYFCTSQFMLSVRHSNNKKTFYTKLFNPLIYLLSWPIPAFSKMFATKYYSDELPK